MQAAQNGHIEVVKLLLAANANAQALSDVSDQLPHFCTRLLVCFAQISLFCENIRHFTVPCCSSCLDRMGGQR
jgi:ankyrin repeat protein